MSKRNWIIIFVIAVGTLAAWLTNIDLETSALFYQKSWLHQNQTPWIQIKNWGIYPPNTLGVGALCVLLVGFFRKSWQKFRRASLFLVVVILLGPGLLVNSVFKEHYGRPRPRQIAQFGQEKQFTKAWVYSSQGGHSFPSGHAAIGFYFISLFYIFKKNQKKIANWCFCGGIAYGLMMSIARIVQGAHFFSDCLWSFAMVWLTCELASHYILDTKKTVKIR